MSLVRLALVALVIAACGGGDYDTKGWSKPYADTTCADFTSTSMNGDQRRAMGFFFLRSLRNDREPSTVQVDAFSLQLYDLCIRFPNEKATDTSAYVWTLDPTYAD